MVADRRGATNMEVCYQSLQQPPQTSVVIQSSAVAACQVDRGAAVRLNHKLINYYFVDILSAER